MSAERCITCGDVAAWMRVAEVDAEARLARCVDPAGRQETVATELVEPVGPGELLLVHAGTALQRRAASCEPPPAGAS